jgi:ABC-type cobalamin transport system permease subunit
MPEPEINILTYSLSRRVRVTCRALLRSVGLVCTCSKNRTWNFSISHTYRPMSYRRVTGR